MDVVTGCGCKEAYRFPHMYLFFFALASLLFLIMFFVLVPSTFL